MIVKVQFFQERVKQDKKTRKMHKNIPKIEKFYMFEKGILMRGTSTWKAYNMPCHVLQAGRLSFKFRLPQI